MNTRFVPFIDSMAFFVPIDLVAGLDAPNDIKETLTGQLDIVIEALENEEDDVAVAALNDFADMVSLENGVTIVPLDADELIAAAENMIDDLTSNEVEGGKLPAPIGGAVLHAGELQ